MWFTDHNSKPLEIKDKINITKITNKIAGEITPKSQKHRHKIFWKKLQMKKKILDLIEKHLEIHLQKK